MPLFIYQCDKGHRFEMLQTIHEEPLTQCGEPHCGSPVHKIITAANFSFKGGAPTQRFYKRG